MAIHQKQTEIHPFADLLGMSMTTSSHGYSEFALTVTQKLLNPHQVLHGGVIYSLADTGMGAAVYTTLSEGQLCATIEIKISYFKPVSAGQLVCKTNIINKGRTIVSPVHRFGQLFRLSFRGTRNLVWPARFLVPRNDKLAETMNTARS